MATDHIASRQVVARKCHQCWVCLGTINPGDKCVSDTNASDGEIYTLHAHTDCNELLRRDHRDHMNTFDDDGLPEGLAFSVFDWDGGEWLDKNAPTVAQRVREYRKAKEATK